MPRLKDPARKAVSKRRPATGAHLWRAANAAFEAWRSVVAPRLIQALRLLVGWIGAPRPLHRKALRLGAVVASLLLAYVAALNAAVDWVGNGGVSLLDPRSLEAKRQALGYYLKHRPLCAVFSDDEPRKSARAAAIAQGIDPDLFLALVEVESGFVAHRISYRGAMGPAQIMPGTARAFGLSDPFDPETSLAVGARYLRQQLDRFRDPRLALAAYNAGPGAVRGAVPRNGETEHYVERVMARYRERHRLRAQR